MRGLYLRMRGRRWRIMGVVSSHLSSLCTLGCKQSCGDLASIGGYRWDYTFLVLMILDD